MKIKDHIVEKYYLEYNLYKLILKKKKTTIIFFCLLSKINCFLRFEKLEDEKLTKELSSFF